MEKINERNVSEPEMTEDVTGIEDAFSRLNGILARMDEEGVSLEESFSLYEQGMRLIKYCNETIDTVEKKVMMLSAEGGTDEF